MNTSVPTSRPLRYEHVYECVDAEEVIQAGGQILACSVPSMLSFHHNLRLQDDPCTLPHQHQQRKYDSTTVADLRGR